MIGKIKRLRLRDVWKHEALGFTKWLEENIDLLNEALDLELVTADREQNAGSFSVDLVAEDADGQTVIIENQLEKSDHDHLGKLITYLVAFEAKAAIWIVSDPRPEHTAAITWLNQSTAASYYLVKAEAIQIDDSPPAPLLTLIVGPSAEGRAVGGTKKELEVRDTIRKDFWTALLEQAKPRTRLHAAISPGHLGWISAGAGISGLTYVYATTKKDTRIELYIDRGKGGDAENKSIFDTLCKHREEIEKVFGESLTWERLDGKRACRIRKDFPDGSDRSDLAKWPQIHDRLIDAMIRFEKALKPQLEKLKRDLA